MDRLEGRVDRLENDLKAIHELSTRLRALEVRVDQLEELLKQRADRAWDWKLAVFAGVISIVSAVIGGVVGAMLAK